jgi:hypothetical protein
MADRVQFGKCIPQATFQGCCQTYVNMNLAVSVAVFLSQCVHKTCGSPEMFLRGRAIELILLYITKSLFLLSVL